MPSFDGIFFNRHIKDIFTTDISHVGGHLAYGLLFEYENSDNSNRPSLLTPCKKTSVHVGKSHFLFLYIFSAYLYLFSQDIILN